MILPKNKYLNTAFILYTFFGCGIAVKDGMSFNEILTRDEAEQSCSPNGQLPMPDSKQTKMSLGHKMITWNLTSVWLAGRRDRFKEWTWINGRTQQNLTAGVLATQKCASYNQTTKELRGIECTHQKLGHICELRGCAACPRTWEGQACRFINNTCFYFYCDELNWYHSRIDCATKNMDLSEVTTTSLLTWMAQHEFACSQFFVGLRREEWVDADGKILLYAAWNKDEPSNGDCMAVVIDSGTPKWISSDCQMKRNTICMVKGNPGLQTTAEIPPGGTGLIVSVVGHDSTKATPPSPDLKIIIGVTVPVVLALVIIGIVVVVVIRKRRRNPALHNEEIELEPLRPGNSAGVGKTNKTLRKLIAHNMINLYGIITKLAWDRPTTVHLDQMYTGMTWVKDRSSVEEDVDYANIFVKVQDAPLPKWILLTGETGTGKTTLIKRLLVDWSYTVLKGEFSQWKRISKRTLHILEKFKYIIPIFLVHVKQNQGLKEIISQQLTINAPDAVTILHYLTNFPERCLLILEGYDEFKEETSEDIVRIAKRELLNGVTIIVTCRTPASYHLRNLNLTHKQDRQFVLKGFSQSNIKEYISKYNENGTDMLSELEKAPDIKEISRFPVMLCLLCFIWKKEKALAHTFTGLYKEIVVYACARYQNKYVLEQDHIDKANLLDEYELELMQISKLATEGLRTQDFQTTFSLGEVREKLDEKAIKLGFLLYDEGDLSASFFHKTFQAFFIAHFVCNADDNERADVLEILGKSGSYSHMSSLILRFVAGLGGENSRSTVENSLKHLAIERTEFLMNYMSEHKDKPFPLPPQLHFCITGKQNIKLMESFLSLDTSQVTLVKITTDTLEHIALLKEEKFSNLAAIEIHGADTDHVSEKFDYSRDKLSKVITFFRLESLTIRDINDRKPGFFELVCKHLRMAQNMSELNLQGTTLSEEGFKVFVNAVDSLLALTSLYCPRNVLSEDSERVAYIEKICALQNLARFYAPPCLLDEKTFLGFIAHIRHTDKFQEVSLVDSGCSNADVWGQFAEALKSHRGLEMIDVSKNRIGCEFLKQITNSAENLQGLLVLRMAECELSDAGPVIDLLLKSQSIQDLDLSINRLGDGLGLLEDIKERVIKMKHINIQKNEIKEEVEVTLTRNDPSFSSKIEF